MNKELISSINTIAEAKRKNKLVVFAGAGISKDSGVPTWDELINEFKQELTLPESEKDYLRIAQMYFDRYQFKAYNEKIRNVIQYKKLMPNRIHEAIFKLEPLHVITTNYDDLLEKVINKEGYSYSCIRRDNEFPYALNNRYLLKIHGDLEIPESIVLKEDDYIRYSENHPLFETFVKSLFASNVILFVGYSFSDINLKYILNNIKNILGSDFQTAYLLNAGERYNDNIRNYFKNRGIEVIEFDDFNLKSKNEDGTIEISNYLIEYLSGKNVLSKSFGYEKDDSVGSRVYNALSFLAVYESFYESIRDDHIIEQMYKSLQRFAEFTSLPTDFVERLYPFRQKDSFYGGYIANSFQTDNLALEKFFKEDVKYIDGITIFEPKEATEINRLQYLQTLFTKVLETLNYSQIWNFQFSDKDFIKDHKLTFLPLKSRKDLSNDHDINSLYWDFKFDDFVRSIEDYNFEDSSDIKSDMQYAFALTHVGRFLEARITYKKIAAKAWHQNKKLLHLLAKRNEKYLGNLLWLDVSKSQIKSEENKSQKSIDEIRDELKEINFQKLISNFAGLDKDQLILVNDTIDKDVISNAKDKIQELSKEIEDAKKLYDNGGFRSGPVDYWVLLVEQAKLQTFYSSNCLIEDLYSDYMDAFRLGFNALLTSYATSKNYQEKLKEFEEFFFTSFVLYGNAKEFKQKIGELKIEKIAIAEKTLPLILQKANNFLKSAFAYNSFTKDNHQDTTFLKFTKGGFFAQKLEGYIKNMLALLYYIELTPTDEKDLINNLVGFIAHQEFLHWDSYDYIAQFMYKHKTGVTIEQIQKLLEGILIKQSFFTARTELYESLFYIAKENNLGILPNQTVIAQLVIILGDSRETRFQISLSYLYGLSNTANKRSIRKIITTNLEKQFDRELVSVSSRTGILKVEDYFDKYAAFVTINLKPRNHPFRNNDEWDEARHIFMSFIYDIVLTKINRNSIHLDSFKDLVDYQKFYLFPNDFDMKNFKVEWLKYNDWYPQVLFKYLKESKNGSKIKKVLHSYLKNSEDEKLALIYAKYFS